MKYVGEAVKEYELSQRRVKSLGAKTLAVKTLAVKALEVMTPGLMTHGVKAIGVKTLGIATWSKIRTDMKNELSNAIEEQVTYYFDIMNQWFSRKYDRCSFGLYRLGKHLEAQDTKITDLYILNEAISRE